MNKKTTQSVEAADSQKISKKSKSLIFLNYYKKVAGMFSLNDFLSKKIKS